MHFRYLDVSQALPNILFSYGVLHNSLSVDYIESRSKSTPVGNGKVGNFDKNAKETSNISIINRGLIKMQLKVRRGYSSAGERPLCMRKVGGSIPPSSSFAPIPNRVTKCLPQ